MVLSQYLSTTQSLIQTPQSPIPLLPTALLTTYVNLARAQIAIDAECIRGYGTATVGAGNVELPITNFTGLPAGVSQGIVVRNATLSGARVDIRPWDWWTQYYSSGQPSSLIPTPVMATQGQGTFATLYLSSGGGTLTADLVLLPINLVTDNDDDAVPYPWTDAVPFYAGWYAYMAMQRQADAETFRGRYHEILRRGRSTVTSTNLPENNPGGAGAQLASAHMPLGMPPQAPARGQMRVGG